MKKKYIVRLTEVERAICDATIKKEKGKSEKLRRATILLKPTPTGQLGMTPRSARRSGADDRPSKMCGKRSSSKAYQRYALHHGWIFLLYRGFSPKRMHKLRNVKGGRP